MKADYILKNGKFYTCNASAPWADAVAIRDGKFVYVGNRAGIAQYEGKSIDLGGKMVLPGLVDAHTHIGLSAMMGDEDDMPMYHCKSKQEVLDKLRTYVKNHPFRIYYAMFIGDAEALEPDGLRKEEIDQIVKRRPVILMENECHSAWLNSGALKYLKVRNDTPDLAPGYSYYERDERGQLTGCIKEMTMLPILKLSGNLKKEELASGMAKLIDYQSRHGVTAVYDAGSFLHEEKIYGILKEMDEKGQLPMRFEATHIINLPSLVDGAIEEFKRLKAKYETTNIKFKTMKMMLDGTLRIHTAKQCTPYCNKDTFGGTLIPEEKLYAFICDLNRKKIDFHVHTVGEGAVKMVLDCVERVIREEGKLDILVTTAHMETLREEDIPRFKQLGIAADFTPRHGGICHSDIDHMIALLGEERAYHTLRAKSVVDSGAMVTFSSDEVSLHDLGCWSPFWGMEVGNTRQEIRWGGKEAKVYPPESERLPLEDLIKGYSITPAQVLRLDEPMGSIETGKDADLVILEENLFEMDIYKVHDILPTAVMFKGTVVSGKLG